MKIMDSRIARIVLPLWRHKFGTLCLAIFLCLCFFSDYSLYNILGLKRQEEALKKEIAVYKDSIASYQLRIDEVSVDEKELERHARENMRMHRENEDLYIFEQ